jgi:hypothetical protein
VAPTRDRTYDRTLHLTEDSLTMRAYVLTLAVLCSGVAIADQPPTDSHGKPPPHTHLCVYPVISNGHVLLSNGHPVVVKKKCKEPKKPDHK